MLHTPMDVLHQFPVRKTKAQKAKFREAVCGYAAQLGYPVQVEAGYFQCQNVVMGNPETADYLITAHYDTCARMIIPNFITPCNGFLYLLYQSGLILGMILLSALTGVLAGLLMGEWAVSCVAEIVFFGILGLMILGPANPSNANDNTSGVVTVLEIMRTLPENQRSKVCFVLFDLEEAGLFGSSSYRKAHRNATDHQLILNLDCVGEGDHIRLFPTKKLKNDRRKLSSLYKACGYFGKKDILVQENGFFLYPSDQGNFPWGVGICALKRRKSILYLGKIHTPKDTVLDTTNINILRAALTTLICCSAVE